MTPEEFLHLKAFKDLLDDTINGLSNATSQATLASAAEEYSGRWREADDDFADILDGIKKQAWSMPYVQARMVSQKVVEHLAATRDGVAAQLKRG